MLQRQPRLPGLLILPLRLRSQPQPCRWFTATALLQAKSTLPTTPARTRFAPSPTGYLHLGSLRTALFNYLLAKKTGGQFLLRLEDTDVKRTVADAEQRLYDDLRWAGLQWDEGPEIHGPYGPYRQSERTSIYSKHAHELLETPHAYRCFCTVERLDELARRRQALGLPTDYDRQCESLSHEESNLRASNKESYVIRLRAPLAYPEFNDLIYGKVGKDKQGANAGITMKHGEIAYEDPILLKSDGKPTYHLANVIDDHLMKITHVVRATEWISSTPKHLALYQAFGWQPPQYAHVGLLVDEEGRKLSKRNFDTTVSSFKDAGLLPETMVNFAALLGWSHGRKSDVMELSELVKEFQMRFTKGNTTVTLDKMWFLQRHHLERAASTSSPSFNNTISKLVELVKSRGLLNGDATAERVLEVGLAKYVETLLKADAKNFESYDQFLDRSIFFFQDPPRIVDEPSPEDEMTAKARQAADNLLLNESSKQSPQRLDALIRGAAAGAISGTARAGEFSIAFDEQKTPPKLQGDEKEAYKAVCKRLRHVLFADRHGPSLGTSLALLGGQVCRHRLSRVTV